MKMNKDDATDSLWSAASAYKGAETVWFDGEADSGAPTELLVNFCLSFDVRYHLLSCPCTSGS